MKILVVYYSMEGHTEKVALGLGSKLNAEIVKIEPAKGSNLAIKGIKAAFGLKSEIKPCQTNLDDIDHLVIATPVWAGHSTPYINKYISIIQNSSGKQFSVIAEMRSSGADKTIAQVRKALEKKSMKFASSISTIESYVDADNFDGSISEFAEAIKKV